MAKALVVLVSVFCIALGGLVGATAQSGTGPLPGCTVEAGAANAGGTRIWCIGSELVGVVDIQGGQYVPGRPKRLNLNLGAGNHITRGYVVLSPDVGKGTILEDGHKRKLALFRSERHGGTQFRIKPTFKRGAVVCDRKGCVNVLDALRELQAR